MLRDIEIKGARENNLKNISLTIPREKFVVFTGVSGSGKSTLAFDTIFAEGQRRYIESLSSYARQFLGQMGKPDVDSIEGLSPTIAIDQKTTSNNPRSTVGTVTEIYDYLRLLFAHIGVPYCPNCHTPISTQTIDDIIDKIMAFGEVKILVLACFVKGKKGRFEKELAQLQKDGFVRVRIDGTDYRLDEEIKLDKNIKHTIYIVVDRIALNKNETKRLTESVETALKLGKGKVIIAGDGIDSMFSTTHSCNTCDYSLEELAPRLFSFNTPYGACPDCNGLGFKQTIDPDKIIKDKNASLGKGIGVTGWTFDAMMSAMFYKAVANHYKVDINTPIKDLPKGMLDMILYGTKGLQLPITYNSQGIERTGKMRFEGIIPNLERRYRDTNSEFIKAEIEKYLVTLTCPTCKGKRLNDNALNVFISHKNIIDVCDMSVDQMLAWCNALKLNATQSIIALPILKEIKARLEFLMNVGLDYLTLNRLAGSLSGGEAQRIRLATQIGSGLTGVIYILDEPSIGLHQKDNQKLITTLTNLRDLGNTVIVVEHDEETMRACDYIVDIGPFAGVNGGKVVVAGTPKQVMNCKESITGNYLSGRSSIEVPSTRREIKNGYITLKGVSQNNLKNINVDIPLGVITCITGVSGSGKSSLVNEVLYPICVNTLNHAELPLGKYKSISGLEKLDKVINIDQTPIGRTPRSNPATYTNVFTYIRELFAKTPDAMERGYGSGRFSFNISGGRCENCGGAGINKIEMFFLPDMYVPCDVCGGKRYNRETLQVKYKGKSISDVLNMTISEANEFFENIPRIKQITQTLVDVGLGYVKLGQPATELSGGEAQRVKLASELCKKSTGKSLYILDEPTTGLSSYDVDKLMKILNRLVGDGNTIVVIEHNVDVISCADYIIDLGPDGGAKGGQVVVTGTPEQVKQSGKGYTSKYIK